MTVEPRVEDLLATIRKAIDADLGGMASASSSTSENSQGTLVRSSIREMRVSYDKEMANNNKVATEISELRNRITRNRAETTFVAPKLQPAPRAIHRLAPAATRGGFSDILNGPNGQSQPKAAPVAPTPIPAPAPKLRPSIIAEDAYEAPEVYEEAAWEQTLRTYDQSPREDYYPQQHYAPQPQPKALVSPQTARATQSSFEHLADSIMARATGDRSLEDMTRDLLRGMLKTWLDDNLPDLVENMVREEIERVARRGR